MPAVIPFIPLIVGGISAGASIYGAHKQGEASKEALGYEKERDKYARATEANRYGAMMEGSQPYLSFRGLSIC